MRFFCSMSLIVYCFCFPAFAGTPSIEAERCSRWLDALVHGQIDKTAEIASEFLRPDDTPVVYTKAQHDNIVKLYDNIVKVGSGSPKVEQALEDVLVKETGNIMKRQIWDFGANAHAYVGCVIYPGTDSPWHLTVKFEDNVDVLTTKLENAAKSRVSSPPER